MSFLFPDMEGFVIFNCPIWWESLERGTWNTGYLQTVKLMVRLFIQCSIKICRQMFKTVNYVLSLNLGKEQLALWCCGLGREGSVRIQPFSLVLFDLNISLWYLMKNIIPHSLVIVEVFTILIVNLMGIMPQISFSSILVVVIAFCYPLLYLSV